MKTLLVMSAFAAAVLSAAAESYTWTGGGTDVTSWNDAANWSPQAVPGGGDTATFTAAATIASAISVASDTLCIVADGAAVSLNGVISGGGGLDLRAKTSNVDSISLSGANTYEGGTRVEGNSYVYLSNATACGANRTITYRRAFLSFSAAGAVYDYDIVPETNDSDLDFIVVESGELNGDIGSNGLGGGLSIKQVKDNTDFVIRGKVFGNVNALCVQVRPRQTTTSDCGIKVLGGIRAYGVYRDATGDGWSHGWFGLGGPSSLSNLIYGWSRHLCLSADAMGNARLNFGAGAYGYSIVDLNGFSQAAKGLTSVETARDKTERNITSASPATLTLRPTVDETAYVAIKGQVSVAVDAASTEQVQEFRTRASETTGALIASNGVLRIGAEATFENVPKLVAADGGTVDVQTGASGALRGVRLIEIAAGGKVDVSAAAANAFAPNVVDVVMETGAELALGSGVALAVRSLKIGENYVNPGTYAEEKPEGVTGEGSLIVPLVPSETSTGVWTGEGATEKSTDGANWQGGYPGAIPVTFAAGGSRALLTADLNPTELLFGLSDAVPSFAVAADASAPAAKIALSGDLVMTNAQGTAAQTATLGVPVAVSAAAMNVRIDGERNTLVVEAPWQQSPSVASTTLNRYGSGTLVMKEAAGTLVGNVYVNGGVNLISGGALGGTAAQPTYVEVNPNAVGGSPITFRWTGGTYNQRFQFIRTGDRNLVLSAAAGSTNVINGSCNLRSNYGNGYVFEEDSSTTFNGGWVMNWIYDGTFKTELYGAKVAVNEKPLQLAYSGAGKFVSFSSQAHDKRSELRFGATGNSATQRQMFAGGMDVVFDVDFAFDANATTGEGTPISFQTPPSTPESERYVAFDFNGHSQRFGRFFSLTSDMSAAYGFWGNAHCVMTSAVPASVYVRMNGFLDGEDSEKPCYHVFGGALSLVKEGVNTLTLGGVSTTTGRLEVAEGRLDFVEGGAMTNVSEVVVAGGLLAVDASARLPARTVYRLSGGKLDLAAGVRLKANAVYVPDGNDGWTALEPGRHTANDLPAYLSGAGSLYVPGGGLAIIVR